MLQRPLDFYQGLNEIDSANVDAFLKGGAMKALQLHKLSSKKRQTWHCSSVSLLLLLLAGSQHVFRHAQSFKPFSSALKTCFRFFR